jgi:hypothetical protein
MVYIILIMGMINIKDNTKTLLNELVYDFQKETPDIKVTQNQIIFKALIKLKGDLQWTMKNTKTNTLQDQA